ncbi:MAG: hypothetical protein L0Y54_07175 [Sporichthyaceae bacterium]|nr:hypothetical protein [Sporichthyaceae bacterium]
MLAPAAVLVVNVVDENGDPLPIEDGLDLSVLARVNQLEIGSGFAFGGASTITIRGLPGAPVLLKVFGEEIWYDRATSEATATLINLTAGQTTEVNFTLPAG